LQFSPWVGLAVFAGWVAVTFAAALVLLRRRDV
jgi:ABC-type transport system involved in multi-copper enzyme maturation permease subunit